MNQIKPNKSFWTIDDKGTYIERDLLWEHHNWFDISRGNYDETRNPDSYNSMFREIFDTFEFDSDGCDYERYGCQILPGDVVVDIGANIGLFSHRAELRGASAVYAFEPFFSTYMALRLNAGGKTKTFKNAVYSAHKIMEMSIPEMLSNTGGGMVKDTMESIGMIGVADETIFSVDINLLFLENMIGKIDFMKMDIEGSELECLSAITDENLSSLRCLAVEFHLNVPGVTKFRDDFVNRCHLLGFNTFQNHYQGGQQTTLNAWKR
jgi:FkbM family methyltransferase